MFDDLTAAIEDIGALCQAGLHPIQDRLILETRDRAELATRASRADFAIVARQLVDVVDFLQTPQQRKRQPDDTLRLTGDSGETGATE